MTARLRASVLASVVLVSGVLALSANANAQTPPGSSGSPSRNREFIVGGVFAGPASMGSADAILLGSNGTPSITLFRTENRMALGFGPEVMLGFGLGRVVRLEVAAGLTRVTVSSRITDDFENAPAEIVHSPALRLAADAAIVWVVRDRGSNAWFVRGSGGFMRESSSDLVSAVQGFIGSGGVGFRHWWRTNGRGRFKQVGLRAEVRGVFRTGGITLSQRTWTVGPAGAAHIVFGY